MLCTNGDSIVPRGETAKYFICKLTNNNCRFSKWCYQLNEFQMITATDGNVCVNLSFESLEQE